VLLDIVLVDCLLAKMKMRTAAMEKSGAGFGEAEETDCACRVLLQWR